MKHLALPDGLRGQAVRRRAGDRQADLMTWDHRGRLWIAETVDYPNEMQPTGQGRDRITICEDTDGDGKADKFTVFADKLSIPTSLCFANGGVIVAQAPDMLFLKDTDGDDKADVRKVLFTGWGTQRHPRRAEQPALRPRQLDLRHRRLLRLHGRRSAASALTSARGSSGSSPTARSWNSSAARTTTPGAWASARRGSSSARRPTAARASTCRSRTATTSRSAAGRPRVLGEHRRLEPVLPDHREGPPGRLARRLHRRRRPRPLHGPDLPEAVLEPHGVRRRADRPPRRHVHARTRTAPTSARTTPGTSWPATTSGPRRSWPRSAPTATSG